MNYSDQAVTVSQITQDCNVGIGKSENGSQLIDRFTSDSMSLGWINRIDNGREPLELVPPTIERSTGFTATTTLWYDWFNRGSSYVYSDDSSTYTGDAPVKVINDTAYLETTRTANETLLAPTDGNVTTLDAFSFVFYYTPENGIRDAVNVSSNPVVLHSYTNIKGQIFNDKYDYNSDKITGKVNGQYDAGEDWTSGDNVRVQLYDEDNNLVQETITNNGYYEFTGLNESKFDYNDSMWNYNFDDKTKNDIKELMANKKKYAVRFIYNGEKYESTIFNDADDGRTNISRAVENGDQQGGGNQPWSRCSRKEFNEGIIVNKKSTDANGEANNNINAGAEVGASTYLEDSNSSWITADTTYREHVNLGLITRYFNLNLSTKLDSMNVSINGMTQDPITGFGNMSKLKANLSSSDIEGFQAREALNNGIVSSDLERQRLNIQQSDYNYTGKNELEVWVNYTVEVKNTSPAYYAKVGKVRLFCDNRFTAIKIGNGSEIPLNSPNDYKSANIIELSGATLGNEGLIDNTNTINISMKLDRETIKNIMDANTTYNIRTLNFLAEIGDHTAYYRDNPYGKGHVKGEIAGKLDENSIPGNFNLNAYNLGNEELEDDTDKALGVELVKKNENESRKITGIVFEDKTMQQATDKGSYNSKNNAKLRYGDGKYDKGQDKNVENVKVKLIDTNNPENTYKEVASDKDGKYTIANVIPSAHYIIEFTYGDGTQRQYNFQDYKSTIDTSNIEYSIISQGKDSKGNIIAAKGAENYWYSTAGNNSVAKDKEEKNNSEDPSMTYNKAVELEKYKDDLNSNLNLSNTATTAEFMVPITEYGDNSNNVSFTVENMNFGLAEKPRSELTINKVIDHLTITTSDGRTLIDGTQGAINSTSWTDRYVQAIVDENLIYGSTLKITYKYYVTNTGEVDFIDDTQFYNYGIKDQTTKVVTTKADKIIDYVDNSLMYDENMQANPEDANNLNKDYWGIANEEDMTLLGTEAKDGAGNINTKIVTIALNKELEPGESTGPIYLTLSKVLLSSEDKNKNALTYNNYAEIIQATNQLGRRSYHTTTTPNNSEKDNYTTNEVKDENGRITGFEITNTGNKEDILLSDVVNRGAPVTEEERMNQTGKQLVLSIPGDLDMSKVSNGTSTLYWEPDSDIDLAGGSVQIVPPFGSQRVIWIIIATVSTTILAVGIILIKKKVLK